MTWILDFLHSQPLMLLFLALGLGTLLGRVRIGFITLGSTASTLLVGLILSSLVYFVTGQRFNVPGEIDTIFLQFFIFAIGLKVGPQFFSGLKREGFHFVALGLITATLTFGLILGASRFFDFAPGFAAGVMSGAYTITAVIGVASGAVDSGAYALHDGMTAEQIKANITAGYAVVYIFSTLCIILMIRYLPSLFGIDPVAAARRTEASFGGGGGKSASSGGGGGESDALPGTNAEFQLGYLPTDIRAYRVLNEKAAGQSVSLLCTSCGTAVLRLLRDGQEVDLSGDPTVKTGDVVTVFGTLGKELAEGGMLGEEVVDPQARDIPMTAAEMVVLKPAAVHKTLGELHESSVDYGLYVRALFRHGHQLPLLPKMELKKGDVLRVYGSVHSVETAGNKVGAVLRPSTATDVATLAFGLVLGFLIGVLSVTISGIPFGLGTSGGVILAGIIIGTIRTYNPRLGGPVPEGARSLMQSIGLDLFIAVLALNVAPSLIDSLSHGQHVLVVLVVGIVAAVVPAFISWLVGLYIFKMDPIILIGAVAGSRNSTPAMNAIQQQCGSATPAIGYPVPYALTAMLVLIYGYLIMLIA
jgi:putative transport protein